MAPATPEPSEPARLGEGTSHTAPVSPPGQPAPESTPPGRAASASGARDANPPPDAVVAENPGVHDQTRNADNTKANDRDRGGTLTPMKQGNGGDEIKISAAIRRGLMSDKSLSFTAKNVKIITQGTKVTLRGPVNSDQEKAAIEARAKQTPGVTDVDDQLEVKK